MSRIPHFAGALLHAMRFDNAQTSNLEKLGDREWRQLLAFCDSSHLTLHLPRACGKVLPEWVSSRIEKNQADNRKRFEIIQRSYCDLRAALDGAGVEHIVLKGFAQWPGYADPQERMQGDIDLFCSQATVLRARDALLPLGFEPLKGFDNSPSDHLPAMVEATDWKWRGDYFDPLMPVSVDLHFRFWDTERHRFGPSGLEQFWHRRVKYTGQDLSFLSLHLADSLGYASLHALRHLLYGSLTINHIYEIGWFLDQSRTDLEFWENWQRLHDPSLRRLEAICFRLAQQWFGCNVADETEREIRDLPEDITRWCEQYGESPLTTAFTPNKDALWLHLALIETARDRRKVFLSRVLPIDLPTVEAVETIQSGYSGEHKQFTTKFGRYFKHVSSRGLYHAGMLPGTTAQGIRWWFAVKGFGKELWMFLGATAFFNCGIAIYFFLFNLYLLDRGFNEDILGKVIATASIGGLAGTLPSGMFAQRFGLRKSLLLCMAIVPALFCLRALAVSLQLQLGLAFLGGFALSMWGVCIPAAMAQLTTEQNRPFGFSLMFAFGIGIGVVAGLGGGSLPGWLAIIRPEASATDLKQWALLLACALAAVGLWPAWRLRFDQSIEKRLFPRSRFLLRFLPAVAIWSVVTGAFSPFFNAYFSQYLHLPVQKIGLIFSMSQFVQVAAILLSPLVFRRFGLVGGIMSMQIATGLSLALLAKGSAVSIVALTYAGFSALQWMNEPGMYSLLMDRVNPADRGGASALNALVIALFQALAAWVAGASFARYGYPAVLIGIGTVALLSAVLFRFLMRESALKEISQEAALASSARL